MGWECELNLPRLEQYDAWGKRVDRLITCSAWKELKTVAAEEGLISIAYERKFGEWRYVVTDGRVFCVNVIKPLLYSDIAFGQKCTILPIAVLTLGERDLPLHQ